MKILISACLMNIDCRYDGEINSASFDEMTLERLQEKHILIPFCPEIYGGLPTPRDPAEIRQTDGMRKVVTKSGKNVTQEYQRGAENALAMAKATGCTAAILKERSPSCGHGKIYDGSFSGKLRDGDGVTAELLIRNGIAVYGESEINMLLKKIGCI